MLIKYLHFSFNVRNKFTNPLNIIRGLRGAQPCI